MFSKPAGAASSPSNAKPDTPEKIIAQKDELIHQLTERINVLKSELSMIIFLMLQTTSPFFMQISQQAKMSNNLLK